MRRVTSSSIANDEGHPHFVIHIGDVLASRRPIIIHTVLGSCIAVCLRDPVSNIGGMNHFMLPGKVLCGDASSRYGIHAMELLINQCMTKGADRRCLEAKVFGGGHMFRTRSTEAGVPQANIRFALGFLQTEGIPVLAKDVGGYQAREVFYYTESGRALLKRIKPSPLSGSPLRALEREEHAHVVKTKHEANNITDDNVTLF